LTAAVAVVRVAELANLEEEGASLAELAKRLDWAPRRLNPAVNYLIHHSLVGKDDNTMSDPFTCHRIMRTRATRGFVRQHS